jgi:hypothetical protein
MKYDHTVWRQKKPGRVIRIFFEGTVLVRTGVQPREI